MNCIRFIIYLQDSVYYKDGDIISVQNSCICPAYTTANGTCLVFSVPLSKQFVPGQDLSITSSFGVRGRYDSTYIFGSATDYTSVPVDRVTTVVAVGNCATVTLDGLMARTNNVSLNVVTRDLQIVVG